MNKKILALIAAGIAAVSLIGCGEDPNAPRYAFVTNSKGTVDAANAKLWDLINAQAAPAEYKTIATTPEEETEEGYEKAFSEAAKAGAKLVFSQGREMGPYVYAAAKAHEKVSFVLIGGDVLPGTDVTEETAIPGNALSMDVAYEQGGFVEGYAAVRNGYRSIAVMAGEKSEENERRVAGFLQGAETAAAELELPEGSVAITMEYAGTDALTPLRMSEAMDLYDAGIETIFTTSEGIGTAVARAAELKGKTFFVTGANLVEAEPTCLMGMTTQLDKACITAIRSFESEAGFTGGSVMDCGFKEDCIVRSADFARFASFTEADCTELIGKIINGSYVVTQKYNAGTGSPLSVTEFSPKGGQ